MNTRTTGHAAATISERQAALTGPHRRTLEAIFRRPAVHDLDWVEVMGLIEAIGHSHEQSNNNFVFEVGRERHLMHKPATKDLTSDELIDLRHFLRQAGTSPEHPSEAVTHPDPASPDLLIVVDHHETKVFRVSVVPDDAAEDVIKPYDPHHILHNLEHKDRSREPEQRATEEPTYYGRVADAVALGGRIVVVGHGAGESDDAHRLTEYLRAHHPETYKRVVAETVSDLPDITTQQLLVIARKAFRQ